MAKLFCLNWTHDPSALPRGSSQQDLVLQKGLARLDEENFAGG